MLKVLETSILLKQNGPNKSSEINLILIETLNFSMLICENEKKTSNYDIGKMLRMLIYQFFLKLSTLS